MKPRLTIYSINAIFLIAIFVPIHIFSQDLTISQAKAPYRTKDGVLFSFEAALAHKVYLAGDFNGWANNSGGKIKGEEFLMRKGESGIWYKTVSIDAPEIRYKYVIEDLNGNFSWHSDPLIEDKDSDGNTVLAFNGKGAQNMKPIISTDRIKLYFDTERGKINYSILGKEGKTVEQIWTHPVILDGEPQSDFRPLKGKDVHFRNKRIQIGFEHTGKRSVAVTLQALDKNSHQFEFRLNDNSSYFGGGERFNTLNQKGNILPMVSIDRPEDKGSVSYKPVPFFMSSKGYGFWIDSYVPGTFDLNATERNSCIFRYQEDKFRCVFITGPEFSKIIEEFTFLTGRPQTPPAWSFAPWKSRNVHKNREEILEDVEKSRQLDLPASVLVIDSPWETGYNNFTLNQDQFKNAKGLFERIQDLGFNVCLWLTPFVNSRNIQDMNGIEKGASSNFEEAERQGHLVKLKNGKVMISEWWKGEGGLVDFTNPKAVDWWHQQIFKSQVWGAKAFKCDDGEGNFISEAVFADGTPASKMKNRYAELYLKTMHEYIGKYLNGDGVLWARPGFTGTQKYPFCWAGDNYADFSYTNGLPTVILAGQNAALSGISLWGHDISGYSGTPTKEVFIRWSQFGAFSPVMQVHMTSNWGPWDFDTETLNIYRKFAKIHMKLFPYIYEAAQESSRTGLPIIRPMVLAFQEDSDSWKHQFQYLFGADFLVAPIYQSGNCRQVYFPKGETWIDYWSGKKYEGGNLVEYCAPLHEMPLFVRDGSIIPMIPDDVDTLVPRHEKMSKEVVTLDVRRILQVWPGKKGKIHTGEEISATMSQNGSGQHRLELESLKERPLEVHLMFVTAQKVHSTNQNFEQVKYDAKTNATILKWQTFSGKAALTWQE